jgi:hypothetical protein
MSELINKIFEESKNQHCTCMYSKKDLLSMPEVCLNTILEGIKALSKRGPWKREKFGPFPLRQMRKKKKIKQAV